MAARTAGGALLQRGPLAAAAGGPHGSTPPVLKHNCLLRISVLQPLALHWPVKCHA